MTCSAVVPTLLAALFTLTLTCSAQLNIYPQLSPPVSPGSVKLWLTISAKHRYLILNWVNAPLAEGDQILVTMEQPTHFAKQPVTEGTPLAGGTEANSTVPPDGVTRRTSATEADASSRERWVCSHCDRDIVVAIQPTNRTQWISTGIPFDPSLSLNITIETECYGYWAAYVNRYGNILGTTCVRAYPRWMVQMRHVAAKLRLRDLMIPGTHDSGSYRPNFDPLIRETLVTKYALTQDEDIRGQLMHGARYLDIRVGYYRNTPEKFFINHGITKQRPLQEVIQQVKDFVHETNEIVIFGLKEFPVGFGKGLGVHRLLVSYLRDAFGQYVVHPSATWRATLSDIWSRQQNVILAYDKTAIVAEFPQVLFNSVEQRWANVRNLSRLEQFLKNVNTYDTGRFYSRPVADMAELTPDTWGVILDKYGGLRKMADSVNWRVSELYRDELGPLANIVAVDFLRSTSLMDIALDVNRRKIAAIDPSRERF